MTHPGGWRAQLNHTVSGKPRSKTLGSSPPFPLTRPILRSTRMDYCTAHNSSREWVICTLKKKRQAWSTWPLSTANRVKKIYIRAIHTQKRYNTRTCLTNWYPSPCPSFHTPLTSLIGTPVSSIKHNDTATRPKTAREKKKGKCVIPHDRSYEKTTSETYQGRMLR